MTTPYERLEQIKHAHKFLAKQGATVMVSTDTMGAWIEAWDSLLDLLPCTENADCGDPDCLVVMEVHNIVTKALGAEEE